MKLSIQEIAHVVGAENNWQKWSEVYISSVEFDTRKVTENSLFVPLVGGARDGHEFLNQAREQGAVLSLWSDTTSLPQPQDFPILVVADTLTALQQLAQYYLKKVGAKVVGITGSNGKTTTKDLVASVLAQGFKTYKTQGNFNNQIGLPYTILSMPTNTEILVLEMGMDRFHEIEFLSQLATPDVAAITMIGESHLEFLGSRQGIAQAKMEIVSGLQDTGLLIVPSDEPLLTDLLAEVKQEIAYFGPGEKSNLVPEITQETQESTSFIVNDQPAETYLIPLIGHYNVNNALIAIKIGRYLGLSFSQIATGLAAPTLTQSRTEWLVAKNGGHILSDVYNANPTAMGLVLKTFSGLTTRGKKIAVLADMKELGPTSKKLHQEMAECLNPTEIQEVYLFGEEMTALYDILLPVYGEDKIKHYHLAEKNQLANDAVASFNSEDLIVLKGSNSMKLIEIVEKLIEN